MLSCPVISDLQYGKVSQRRLCALGVSALDFASSATPLFSASSALFALLVAQCFATNHLESTSSALFCKDQGVGTSLLIPFRSSIGRQCPFSLTPVFATHPKNAPVTPLLATLPKTWVLKVLCLPHIQKMAGGYFVNQIPDEGICPERPEGVEGSVSISDRRVVYGLLRGALRA